MSLEEYISAGHAHIGPRILHIPAGTEVPIRISVSGDVISGNKETILPVKLSKSLDVVIEGSVPNGMFRIEQGPWKGRRRPYHIRDVEISSAITPKVGPKVDLSLFISTADN